MRGAIVLAAKHAEAMAREATAVRNRHPLGHEIPDTSIRLEFLLHALKLSLHLK